MIRENMKRERKKRKKKKGERRRKKEIKTTNSDTKCNVVHESIIPKKIY